MAGVTRSQFCDDTFRPCVPGMCGQTIERNGENKKGKKYSGVLHGTDVELGIEVRLAFPQLAAIPRQLRFPSCQLPRPPPFLLPTFQHLQNSGIPDGAFSHIPATSDGASISIIIPFDKQNVRESLIVGYSSRFQDMPRGDQRS